MAQFSAPSSWPAKRAFLRVRACGRIERLTMLVSSSMRPSSRKRVGGQHFGLAVQRKVPAVFGNQHRGDHGFGRQSGFDQMLRGRRLHNPLAGPAGKLGPMRDDHPVLGRDHVEPLGSLFADHVHRLLAAWAVAVGRRDRLVNARQMSRQRAAVGSPFPRRIGDRRLLLDRLGLGDCLLDVFQRQIELVGIKLGHPGVCPINCVRPIHGG
jgi:hypothetical protein